MTNDPIAHLRRMAAEYRHQTSLELDPEAIKQAEIEAAWAMREAELEASREVER